jgi:LytS/YehU family sensor histidine kinase
VLVCSLSAAAIDWAVTTPFQRWGQIEPVHWLWVLGFTWLRATQYVGWSGLYFWIKSAIAARERAMNLIRAEAAAREAELRMLRAQIDPHFLFNALNTVLAGIPPEQRKLNDVVQGLADYLRYSLANRHLTLVALGDEFDAALNYLTVEKARFRDDLQVEAHIDEAARRIPAPGIFLQPLIENAVKHGYRSSPAPLRLRVNIRVDASGGAEIEVANSGRWIDPPRERAANDAGGHGLESIRRRLALLYPGTHEFALSTAGEQVSIRIHLPPASSLLETA